MFCHIPRHERDCYLVRPNPRTNMVNLRGKMIIKETYVMVVGLWIKRAHVGLVMPAIWPITCRLFLILCGRQQYIVLHHLLSILTPLLSSTHSHCPSRFHPLLLSFYNLPYAPLNKLTLNFQHPCYWYSHYFSFINL